MPAGRHARAEGVMAKMLSRVVTDIRNRGVEVTPALVDMARSALESRAKSGAVQDRELRGIATQLIRAQAARPPVETSVRELPSRDTPPPETQLECPADATSPPPRDLLMNTSKRQRQLLADAKWIEMAECDRTNAKNGRVQDAAARRDRLSRQRAAFDSQIDEHNRQKAEDAAARRRAQDEMTRTVENARELTRQERENAHRKALQEKAFHEQQARELEDRREHQRSVDRAEQARHLMMVRNQMERQRQEEADRKERGRQEWVKTLHENEKRQREKEAAKDAERELDRHFQQQYSDQLDKQDRDRAEAMARKEARQGYNQKMLQKAAAWHVEKVENLDKQIEAEFQEQLRREQADERARQDTVKQRLRDTQRVLTEQVNEKKREAERQRKEDARRAEEMREEAREIQRQEDERRRAARAEALRMREFLNTQLQMQHFKETKDLETSIARPESNAHTMYSPSRPRQ